ncbi:NUDIX domain-containing protein [Kribbella solani]|uniref:NUDIX hydrolase n=1 Tax=Kribbella solani TaxID=236067 RepID=UPI0029A47B75|nr:NUDIX domain-containing protein [Kribbella solani]MDX3005746.1 NUDIX domain-containing protein [Kribbella solani]
MERDEGGMPGRAASAARGPEAGTDFVARGPAAGADFVAVGLAADLVILTVRDGRLQVLLIRRGIEPYLGRWALPGGFVRPDEDLEATARRELAEETGLSSERIHLEQVATYGAPDRDPRGRVVSVAYLALVPDPPAPVAGSDASSAEWVDVADLLQDRAGTADDGLAFDHRRILGDGVERARAKLEYSPLATAFCPAEFTISELRGIYEAVWGTPLDPRNFHRKVTKTPGFVEPSGATTTRDGGRPAQLFHRGTAHTLHPPMTRAG